MSGAFLSPDTCGFAKIAALEIEKQVKNKGESSSCNAISAKEEQYRQFNDYFNGSENGENNFQINFSKYRKNLLKFKTAVNKWSFRKSAEKKEYLDTFSLKQWQKLSQQRKDEHSLAKCRGCAFRYSTVQALFPVKSRFLQGRCSKSNPVLQARNQAERLKSPTMKQKQSDAKKSAKAMYEVLSKPFENTFGTTFAEAMVAVPELDLKKGSNNKENQGEKHKLRREQYRKAKTNIQEQMKDTAFMRLYGTGQSVQTWQRNRLALCFEPKASAIARSEKPKKEEKQKDHVGNFDQMTWDKKELLAEVESYEDGHKINWTHLATQFNVTNKDGKLAKNGGQIVKAFLISNGVNLNRFEIPEKKSKSGGTIVRRKKRRITGGEISFPTEVHPKVLKEMLHEKLQSGVYTIGERIVPKKYEKLVLGKDLKIVEVEFTIEGRKVPLNRIRQDLLQNHSEFLRKNKRDYYEEMSQEQVLTRLKDLGEIKEKQNLDQMKQRLASLEATRNLMVWLDNSTVANHGHLLCLITCLYDPAVFYTSEEYKSLTGKDVDIQKEIEKPEVHFIARCSSADAEQLTYTETRLECIQQLKNNVNIDGVQYEDKLRFFHGDNPARAHEAGQQKGGNYFCSTCEMHSVMSEDLAHVLNCKIVTLEARQKSIMSGKISRHHSKNLKTKPLGGLKKHELEQELASRGIYDDGKKDELQGLLNKEMRGKQRVPALLFNNPQESLKELCLQDYEILPCEPLHDVGHHIENVFTELPVHLKEEESKALEESLELCIGNKDSKRTADYRSALVKTAAYLIERRVMSDKPLAIINSLIEMQRILYSPESQRSPSLILRYCNQSWLHSILLAELIQKPKKLTRRKLFGVYFHNLSAHASLMLRLISGQASNAEQQERMFNHVKRITRSTSNYHPEQIIPNLFVRLQAEKEMGLHSDDASQQQHEISKLAKSLPPPKNTIIPLNLVRKHSREWQSHLQRISDFLLEGDGVWWKRNEEAIIFNDVTDCPNIAQYGPQLHHFRSSSLKEEEAHLEKCWEECIANDIPIPADVTKVNDQQKDDTIETVHRPSLQEDIDGAISDDVPQTAGVDEQDNLVEQPEIILDVQLSKDEIITLQESDHPEAKYSSAITSQAQATTSNQLEPLVLMTDSQQSVKHMDHSPLKTRLAKAVQIVLGDVKDVRKLDRKRCVLKEVLKTNNMVKREEAIKNYETVLVPLQTKILAEHSKVKRQFDDWEKDYYIKNQKAATYDMIKSDKVASVLLNKIKYAKALIKEWKITL